MTGRLTEKARETAERTAGDEMVSDELAGLERRLWLPSRAVVMDLARLPGDLLLLGAGGAPGLSLARMAREAYDRGPDRGREPRVIAVSRFAEPRRREEFIASGVEAVAADLNDPGALDSLPEATNVVYLIGRTFGRHADPRTTWAVNAYVPARAAERFAGSRVVALSTGSVYPPTPVGSGGADERTPPGPADEYAQACLGRERLLQHVSITKGARIAILRLSNAIDLRYGVLHEIARAVWAGKPVDVATGCVNVLWQGDVNAIALRSLLFCQSPPDVLNVTGPETVSVRWLAHECGRRLGREPVIVGTEAPTAMLSNAAQCMARFGYPTVTLAEMLDWTCQWVTEGGELSRTPSRPG